MHRVAQAGGEEPRIGGAAEDKGAQLAQVRTRDAPFPKAVARAVGALVGLIEGRAGEDREVAAFAVDRDKRALGEVRPLGDAVGALGIGGVGARAEDEAHDPRALLGPGVGIGGEEGRDSVVEDADAAIGDTVRGEGFGEVIAHVGTDDVVGLDAFGPIEQAPVFVDGIGEAVTEGLAGTDVVGEHVAEDVVELRVRHMAAGARHEAAPEIFHGGRAGGAEAHARRADVRTADIEGRDLHVADGAIGQMEIRGDHRERSLAAQALLHLFQEGIEQRLRVDGVEVKAVVLQESH